MAGRAAFLLLSFHSLDLPFNHALLQLDTLAVKTCCPAAKCLCVQLTQKDVSKDVMQRS